MGHSVELINGIIDGSKMADESLKKIKKILSKEMLNT
jgi:hypothetical protein